MASSQCKKGCEVQRRTAKRKGGTLGDVERWLSANLGYEPEP